MSTSNSSGVKTSSGKLENIEEETATSWLPLSSAQPPETPTETMEYLARSWSISAMELSKALGSTAPKKLLPTSADTETSVPDSNLPQESLHQSLPCDDTPPVSPRDSEDMKDLLLLHQALNPDFLSNQQLLKTGLYKSVARGKTMGRWLKDQKERKKQEIRTHNAQLHAAVSVAGVAAAVAALAASMATPLSDLAAIQHKASPRTTASLASAAALVASHCIEIAEDMGANQDQILTVVSSAINARTNGDIMTLTAGAATALRGAATLRSRLNNGLGAGTFVMSEEKLEKGKEFSTSAALNFVTSGGELLKRTRKGDLHWKQVSFRMNANWQVIAKMKSKHMGGTFTKKKKCAVTGIYCDVAAWLGREREESGEQRAYFGIKTADRVIEFECRSKGDKKIWTEGIQHLLHCRGYCGV